MYGQELPKRRSLDDLWGEMEAEQSSPVKPKVSSAQPRRSMDDLWNESQQYGPDVPGWATAPPIEKPAGRTVTPKPLPDSEQRFKQAANTIREIEGRKARAVNLFEEANRTPDTQVENTYNATGSALPLLNSGNKPMLRRDTLRAKAEGELEAANRLGEEAAKRYSDLVEVGYGTDADPNSNRRWVYAKPKHATVQMYRRPSLTEQAAASTREDIDREVKQQHDLEAQRKDYNESGWLGQTLQKISTDYLSRRPDLTPAEQDELAIRRKAMGIDAADEPGVVQDLVSRGGRALLDTIPSAASGLANISDSVYRRANAITGGRLPESADWAPVVEPWAREVSNTLAPLLPTDPRRNEDFSSKVASGIGSALGFGTISGAANAMRIPSQIAVGTAGAGLGVDEIVQEARAAGFDPQQDPARWDKMVALAGASGMTEIFGFGKTLDRWGLKRPFVKRALEVLEEGGQEALQQYLGNVNAAYVGQYDKARPQTKDILENAVIGGIIGGGSQVADIAAEKLGQIRGARAVARESLAPMNLTPSVAPGTATERITVPPSFVQKISQQSLSQQPGAEQQVVPPVEPLPLPVAPSQVSSTAIPAPVQPSALFPEAQPVEAPAADLSTLSPQDRVKAMLEQLQQKQAGRQAATLEQGLNKEFAESAGMIGSAAQTWDTDRPTAEMMATTGAQRLKAALNNLQKSEAYQMELGAVASGAGQPGPYIAAAQSIQQQLNQADSLFKLDAERERQQAELAAQAEKEQKRAEKEQAKQARFSEKEQQKLERNLIIEQKRAETQAKRDEATAKRMQASEASKQARRAELEQIRQQARDEKGKQIAQKELDRIALHDAALQAADTAGQRHQEFIKQGQISEAINELLVQQKQLGDAVKHLPRTPEAQNIKADLNRYQGQIGNRIGDLRKQAAGRNVPVTQAIPPLLRSDAVVNPAGGVPPMQSFYEPGAVFDKLNPSLGDVEEDSTPLLTAVRRAGGIANDAISPGELRRLGVKESGTTGLVNNKGGLSPDRMREALVEAGYLPQDSTVDDLFQAIEGEMRAGQRRARPQGSIADFYDEWEASQNDGETGRRGDGERSLETQSGRQSIEEPVPDAESEDMAALHRAIERSRQANPRAYGDNTRPGAGVPNGVSFSPFADLEARNREQNQALYDNEPGSETFNDAIDWITEDAAKAGIDPRHVDAMVAYALNWHGEKAFWERQGLSLETVQQSAESLDADIGATREKIAALPTLYRTEAEQEVAALDVLFDDRDAVNLLDRIRQGDDNAVDEFQDYAATEHGLSEETISDLIRVRRPVRRGNVEGTISQNAKSQSDARNPGTRTGANAERKRPPKPTEHELRLLRIRPIEVFDKDYDRYTFAVEDLHARAVRGEVDINPLSIYDPAKWNGKSEAEVEAMRKAGEKAGVLAWIRAERSKRVEQGRLPARETVELVKKYKNADLDALVVPKKEGRKSRVEQILQATETVLKKQPSGVSQEWMNEVRDLNERAARAQAKHQAGRTVSHPNPAIDGKSVLARTGDGRVVVENSGNKSGISVVKDYGSNEKAENGIISEQHAGSNRSNQTDSSTAASNDRLGERSLPGSERGAGADQRTAAETGVSGLPSGSRRGDAGAGGRAGMGTASSDRPASGRRTAEPSAQSSESGRSTEQSHFSQSEPAPASEQPGGASRQRTGQPGQPRSAEPGSAGQHGAVVERADRVPAESPLKDLGKTGTVGQPETHTRPSDLTKALNHEIRLLPAREPSESDAKAARSIPTFQGGKTKLARAATSYIRRFFGNDAAKIEEIDDWFAGSGSWGAYLATTVFSNVKKIRIYEFNPARAEKVKLFHEKGDKIAEIAKDPSVARVLERAVTALDQSKTFSGTAVASAVNRVAGGDDAIAEGLLQAIIDQGTASFATQGKTGQNAVQSVLRSVEQNARSAFEQVKMLRQRGVEFEYLVGNSYAMKGRNGSNILSVVDPPYYGTKGYNGQALVGLETYRSTANLLTRLRENQNSIIYTDEAWWEKHDESGKSITPPDAPENLFGDSGRGTLTSIRKGMGDFFRIPIAGRIETMGLYNGTQSTSEGRTNRVAETEKSADQSARRGDYTQPVADRMVSRSAREDRGVSAAAEAVGPRLPGKPVTYQVYRGVGERPNDFGVAGKGEYWSGREHVAKVYAGKTGAVKSGQVTLNRPLSLSYSQLNKLQQSLYGESLTGFESELSDKFDQYLREQGYDGVVLFDPEISTTVPEEIVRLAPRGNPQLERSKENTQTGLHVGDTFVSDKTLASLSKFQQAEIQRLRQEYAKLGVIRPATELGPDQFARLSVKERRKISQTLVDAKSIEDRVQGLLKPESQRASEQQKTERDQLKERERQLLRQKSDMESAYATRLQSSRSNEVKTAYEDVKRELADVQSKLAGLESSKVNPTSDKFYVGDSVTWQRGDQTESGKIIKIVPGYATIEKANGDKPTVHVSKLTAADAQSKLRDQKTPGFYSQLTRVIDQKMPAKASAAQVRAIIENPQSGVKPDEIKWTGLDDYLRGKETVTKADVQEFLKANQVDVQEVTRGGSPYRTFVEKMRNKYGDDWVHRMTLEEEAQKSAAFKSDTATPPKYSEYTLPGAKEGSYRELLLTLPQKSSGRFEARLKGSGYAVWDNDASEWVSPVVNQDVAEGSASRQNALTGGNYKSSHFDEPNILAHIRFNERADSEGKKVLHVEEIQSDWHQEGRKKGYGSQDGYAVKDSNGRLIARQPTREAAEQIADDLRNGRTPVQQQRGEAGITVTVEPVKGDVQGVPDAPFKKNWHELAFKRALRYAAENGYDKMTWTTGEQQAERFDLSKQIDSLDWLTTDGKTFDIAAMKNGEELVRKDKLTPEQLEETVGKEAAQKIIDRAGNRFEIEGEQVGTLKGLDLKVGGEGMKGFYDSILPAFANKYAKKWGAKVGEAKVHQTPMPFAVVKTANNAIVEKYTTRTEAEAAIEGMPQGRYAVREAGGPIAPLTVHSIDITPAMRESVMQGQTLFQKTEAPTAATVLADAQIQFKSGKRSQPGTLYANNAALDILRAAYEQSHGEQRYFANVNMNRTAAERIARALLAESQDTEYTPATQRKLREIAREFNLAAQSGSTVSIVETGGGRTFSSIKTSRRHELFHDAQEGLENSRGFLAKHKYAQQLIDGLAARGYAPEDRTVEAAAFIAGGQAKDFGLTEAQGNEFLEDYFDDIVKTNGAAALKRFFSVAPHAVKTLKQARQKYGIEVQGATGADRSRARREGETGRLGTNDRTPRQGEGLLQPAQPGRVREQRGIRASFGELENEPSGTVLGSGLGGFQGFTRGPQPKSSPYREIFAEHKPLVADPYKLQDHTIEELLSAGAKGTLPGARALHWASKLKLKRTADKLANRQADFITKTIEHTNDMIAASEAMRTAEPGSNDYQKAKRKFDNARLKIADALAKAGEYTTPIGYTAKAYKSSLLSAPHIHLFNMLEQAFKMPLHQAQRAADAIVPASILNKYGIPYTKAITDFRDLIPAITSEARGLVTGLKEVPRDVVDMFRYGVTRQMHQADDAESGHASGTDKFELGHRAKMIPGLDQVLNFIGRSHGAADIAFSNMVNATAISAQANAIARKIGKENGLSKQEMNGLARDLAERPSALMVTLASDATLRFKLDYPTLAYDALQKLRDLPGSVLGKAAEKGAGKALDATWKAAMDFVVPFSKIPLAAVDTYLFRYSPVAFGRVAGRMAMAKGGDYTGRYKGEFAKQRFGEDTAELFRQGLVGSLSWALLGALGSFGYLSFTGGGEDDKDRRNVGNVREALRVGYGPEVRAGDYAFNLNRMGPVGQAAGIATRIYAAQKPRTDPKTGEPEDASKRITRTANAAKEGLMFNNPLGQAAKDIAGDDAHSTSAGQYVAGKLRGFVPGLARDIAKIQTPTKRMPEESSTLGRLKGDLQSGMPVDVGFGSREQMPERLDALGRPIEEPNPFTFWREIPRSPQLEEMERLGVGFAKPKREKGETATEYNRKIAGFTDPATGEHVPGSAEKLQMALRRIAEDATWANRSDEAKARIYSSELSAAGLKRADKVSEGSFETEREIEALRADAYEALRQLPSYQRMKDSEKESARDQIDEQLKRFRARAESTRRTKSGRVSVVKEKAARLPEYDPLALARMAVLNAQP